MGFNSAFKGLRHTAKLWRQILLADLLYSV